MLKFTTVYIIPESRDTFNDDLGDLVSGPNRPIQKVNTKLHLVLSSLYKN